MGEKEFIVYLDEAHENRYRHWHMWRRGEIVEFRIQYEAWMAGRWQPIVRYDTAHGQPHRDILHPARTQTKEMYPGRSNAEMLTLGQEDIMENWSSYRAKYEQEAGQ